jgi:hypothetical protein
VTTPKLFPTWYNKEPISMATGEPCAYKYFISSGGAFKVRRVGMMREIERRREVERCRRDIERECARDVERECSRDA